MKGEDIDEEPKQHTEPWRCRVIGKVGVHHPLKGKLVIVEKVRF
jgi:hypothetical protein